MNRSIDNISKLAKKFALERDWQQFQSPKNLSMALAVEVAELLELFQWLGEEESRKPGSAVQDAAADEVADIMLYLVRIADELDIDIHAAVEQKAKKNALKYPVEKVKGSARKYTEYVEPGD